MSCNDCGAVNDSQHSPFCSRYHGILDDEDSVFQAFKCFECGHVTEFYESEYENAEDIFCERCFSPLDTRRSGSSEE